MLLFIVFPRIITQSSLFISKHLMLLFIFVKYSADRTENKFQNISCYCLSIAVYFFGTGFPVFQNISCYCLSLMGVSYPGIIGNFKTSHVIVYPSVPTIFAPVLLISKHLMLLFIQSNRIPVQTLRKFQNISCYCLSQSGCL